MDREIWFLLSCLATFVVILLSLLVFRKKPPQIACSVSATNPPSAPVAAELVGEYEVFLSFRGPDTRDGFTDYLYEDLVHADIHTFRDDNELRIGEEIASELLKAIKESKIFIPIFSKGYASSKWCLIELAQMVDCARTTRQKILPIFFDVEPDDVKRETGSYAMALREHQKRQKSETVQAWKQALTDVAKLKGWNLKKDTNGHQGELVKMVVSKVLLELKKDYMAVTENLVGIEHHSKALGELLNIDSNDVRMVGIHGISGIGKTTIAKVIYNQHSECFEGCCFLSDIRESSQQYKGLVNLQSELITKIRKRKCPDIANVDEGLIIIKDTLHRKKVLIVLDDVDDASHFTKLVGKWEWFDLGSRIIITTRNKEVLDVLKVDRTYEPPFMNHALALSLFCKHALRRDIPPKEYYSLSNDIACTAAGLPLALEIIGSFLLGKEKPIWEDTLKKLKEIPHEGVQNKLKISYQALDNVQKQIFLDIACLFIGEDKRNPFYMWHDCKFYPTNGINVLLLRSLVKITDTNKLWMHDQLRDMGRQIVRGDDLELGEQSRLWIHEEALDVLERQLGTKKVKALRLNSQMESHCRCFSNEGFQKLSNLRFLQVDNTYFMGDFKHLLLELRWLHWGRCPGNFTPTNFHLRNLVILDLSRSKITDDWDIWSQIKMAKKLKVLNLSHCSGLTKTPDFSTFTSLERLILRWCKNLVEIDQSIRNLIYLRELDITYSGIAKLPDTIGNLERLEEIEASCSKLLGEIPCDIGKLSSLKVLCLSYTKICGLPVSICELSCLQTLDLTGCTELQSLPKLPPSLTSLHVTSEFIQTLPSLSNLTDLKNLSFDGCPNLVELPNDTGTLSKLEILKLHRTNIITLPAEMSSLSRLKQLQLLFCNNLQCVQGLPPNLFELCISNCKSVRRLPDLSYLKNLSILSLISCSELMEIQGLGKLKLLTSLDASGCGKLATLDGLELLESLRFLNISKCRSLERLIIGPNLKKLQMLDAMGCRRLSEIQGLKGLESLRALDMEWCMSMERLPDLSDMRMIRTLILRECKKLADIGSLRFLKFLEKLDMSGCTSLERLPDLSDLERLKELMLRDCEKLEDVVGLRDLKSLEKLDLSWCMSLERLDLSNLRKLKELTIRGWKSLSEICGLGELESLELLDIAGCELIERTPDLSSLKKLKKLIVLRCEKLSEIRGLPELKSLTLLEISGCTSLENLPDLPNTKVLTDLVTADFWFGSPSYYSLLDT